MIERHKEVTFMLNNSRNKYEDEENSLEQILKDLKLEEKHELIPKKEEVERVSTGVEDLDRALEGGVPKGTWVAITGEPGTGKSLPQDEEVVTIIGRELIPMRIKDLYEIFRRNINVSNIHTVSVTRNFRITISRVYGVARLYHRGEVIEVITETGRRVICTPDHSLLTYEPQNGWRIINASEIIEGNTLIPTYPLQELNRDQYTELKNTYVIFDRVAKVRKFYYEGYVYDLGVSKYENFITRDGLFVHNSILCMHFAWAGLKEGEPVVYVTTEAEFRDVVKQAKQFGMDFEYYNICLLYTSPSPRDLSTSRMPSSA